MTAIALKGFSAVNLIVDSIISFFKGLGKAVIMARATEVNYQVAHELQHEYKNMSVAEIAQMLNQRTYKELYNA
jgi:hypothetical protein